MAGHGRYRNKRVKNPQIVPWGQEGSEGIPQGDTAFCHKAHGLLGAASQVWCGTSDSQTCCPLAAELPCEQAASFMKGLGSNIK